MPYVVAKDGNTYVVKKMLTGKVVGRHATKAKAEAQIRAINQSERRRNGR